ncbi:MAG: hypothetical protein ACYS7M_10730 [Planctomycetota bacterium]|jgi:hypothetical protein
MTDRDTFVTMLEASQHQEIQRLTADVEAARRRIAELEAADETLRILCDGDAVRQLIASEKALKPNGPQFTKTTLCREISRAAFDRAAEIATEKCCRCCGYVVPPAIRAERDKT